MALAFFAFLIAILFSRRYTIGRDLYSDFSSRLAGFSYTLYAVHLPPLILFRSLWTFETPWPQDLKHWSWLVMVASGIMLYAFVLSLITEAHTDKIRRWFVAFLISQKSDTLRAESHP